MGRLREATTPAGATPGSVTGVRRLPCLLALALAACSPPEAPGEVATQPAGAEAQAEAEAEEHAAGGGGHCSVSQGARAHEQFGYAFGAGPVYTVLGTPGTEAVKVVEEGSLRLDGMRVAKIMWVAEPSFTGEATVRASRLDGGAFLLDVDGAAEPARQPLDAFDSEVTLSRDSAGSASEGWLFWPSAGAFAGPGCHSLSVATEGEQWEIHFEVRFD